MRASILDRIERAEACARKRAHRAVILYRDPAEIPGLLDAAMRAGELHAPYGVLALPVDVSLSQWLAEAARFREESRVLKTRNRLMETTTLQEH